MTITKEGMMAIHRGHVFQYRCVNRCVIFTNGHKSNVNIMAMTKGITTGKAMAIPRPANTNRMQRSQYCMDCFPMLSPTVQMDYIAFPHQLWSVLHVLDTPLYHLVMYKAFL